MIVKIIRVFISTVILLSFLLAVVPVRAETIDTNGWVVIEDVGKETECGTKIVKDPNTGRLWVGLVGYGISDNYSYYSEKMGAYSDDNGQTWSLDLICLRTEDNFSDNSPPNLAIQSNGDVWAIWYEIYGEGFIRIFYSVRNHETELWAEIVEILYPGIDGMLTFSKYSPAIAVDASNFIHVSFTAMTYPDYTKELWYLKYTTEWSSPELVYQTGDYFYMTALDIEINHLGKVYILFKSWEGELNYIVNTIGTWGDVQSLSSVATDDYDIHTKQASMIIDPSDNVHFAYFDFNGDTNELEWRYRKESNGVLEDEIPGPMIDGVFLISDGWDTEYVRPLIEYSTDGKLHLIYTYTHREILSYEINNGVWSTGVQLSDNYTYSYPIAGYGSLYPLSNGNHMFLSTGYMLAASDWMSVSCTYFYADGSSLVLYPGTPVIGNPREPGDWIPPMGIPSNWYNSCGNLSQLPFYGTFNEKSVEMGMDTCTLYLLIILAIATSVGLGILLFTGSTLMALIGTTFTMGAGVSTTVVAGWITAFFLIIGLFILYLSRQH